MDEPKKPASRVDGKKLMRLYEKLVSDRAPWVQLWEEIAQYIVPRRYPGMNGSILTPSTQVESRLFDSTAIHAHQTNAAGCLAWMTPADSPWFAYKLPPPVKDDTARRWLADASQAARESLARGNFYSAIHECYLDRSGPGTCALYCEQDEEDGIFFQNWSCGTFVIAEDHKGRVNTVVREFTLTASQAYEKWGDACSPEICKAAKAGDDKGEQRFDFLHFVMPRSKAHREDATAGLQARMPFACYYVDKKKQTVIKESGYPRFPVMVSRYLEWGTGTGGVYGWSPAFSALPEARQVNFLQKFMDALAEKAAFPPWMVPEDFEGEIDPNAAGVNYFARGLQAHEMPREMPQQGRYDIGKDRVMERQKAINQAFHVDLFQMFASMEKTGQMTAREVAERTAEKLVQFSPTFSRMTSELLSPLARWVFTELLGQGAFGRPESIPLALLSPDRTGLMEPAVKYSSRLAMSLEQLPTIGAFRTLDLCQLIAAGSGNPSVYDNFNWDEVVRNAALQNGMEAHALKSIQERDELREARAQAQQQAEQMQMAAAAADAAGKVGNIKQDSLLGSAIQSAAA